MVKKIVSLTPSTKALDIDLERLWV